jgi:cell division protein FtsB
MSSTAPQLRSRLPRLAEVAVQRARLTVVPRPLVRSRAPRVPFVIFVSAILLAGVIGLLMFNTSMQQASFRASALSQQADDLTARQEALNLELQALRDPQHIAFEARQLGMTMPGSPGVLKLGDGSTAPKILNNPTPALPGNVPPLNAPAPKMPAALNPPPRYVRERPAGTDKNTADTRRSGAPGQDEKR